MTATIKNSDLLELLRPKPEKLFLIFDHPSLRPPVLEEMQPDIDRVIASVAYQYTDQSTPFLHTDELQAEGRAKLAHVICEKGYLKRAKNRTEFFKLLTTSVNNHVRSLVQKYRYTQKRTGIKPPPKNDKTIRFESLKPNEISLDDPNAHLQVGEPFTEPDQFNNEFLEDLLPLCTPIERIVLNQLNAPNIESHIYAELESLHGKKAGAVKIKFTQAHMAQGLGISLELFKETVLQVRAKTLSLMNKDANSDKYDGALATLCNIFSLQIPKTIPPVVVRRLLTIAARDQWNKVNGDVHDLLEIVGAKAPKFHGEVLGCFGVLYQKGHRICSSCGLQESCRAEAENLGLGEITISPKLLGSKLTRTPFILPSADEPENSRPVTSNPRDMEIYEYLIENFKRVVHDRQVFFRHKDRLPSDRNKLIFCVGKNPIPLRLRFCSPAAELKEKLVSDKKCWYAPDTMPANEVIELINTHAELTYV
jgi:hypothetical protein